MFSFAVIDDALCEKRLWDMKYGAAQNFYMCEIRKDFTIDATFKGNISRFLNHGCDPNCVLEKWLVSKNFLLSLPSYLQLIPVVLLEMRNSWILLDQEKVVLCNI